MPSAIFCFARRQNVVDVDVKRLGFFKHRQQLAGFHFEALDIYRHLGFKKHVLAEGIWRREADTKQERYDKVRVAPLKTCNLEKRVRSFQNLRWRCSL